MKRNRTVSVDIADDLQVSKKLNGKSFSELVRELLREWLVKGKSAHK